MMKIYIARYGQTTTNMLKCHSYENDDLTELGIQQAEELKEKIKDIKFDAIIISPLLRTKHTAEIIANNQEFIFDDRIKERDPGNLSGKSRENEDREEYWNYYTDIQYGTSENIKDFFERVFNFLDELKTKKYNCVLIVDIAEYLKHLVDTLKEYKMVNF